MMNKPILEINGISKKYIIGHREKYLSLRDEIVNFISPSARKKQKLKGDFWALKNVNFSVNQGDAVGIIGRNGAGKSTILKILSKITPPTEGNIIRRGRVASLLEVGTGFHPELTGKENIYLNGAILGMTNKEVQRKFDEIVAFSEIEKFLDTPVKRYSSGMYVRLAFAVAAHLEPEILVVDEVLAVGDVEFQKKCLGKMGDVAKGGRTILFVSHNLSAVNQLCNKGIVLNKGEVAFNGTAGNALDFYTQMGGGVSGSVTIRPEPILRKDDEKAAIVKVCIEDTNSETKDTFMIGEQITASFDIEIFEPIGEFQLSFALQSSLGLPIYHCVSRDDRQQYFDGSKTGRIKIKATFPHNKLYPGKYSIDEFWLARKNGDELCIALMPITFIVPDTSPLVLRTISNSKGLIYETPEWSQQ